MPPKRHTAANTTHTTPHTTPNTTHTHAQQHYQPQVGVASSAVVVSPSSQSQVRGGGWAVVSSGAPSVGSGRKRRGSQSPNTRHVDYHAGMLRKLKVGRGWKQRYVTVCTGASVLEYRRSKGDDKPRGAIELTGATVTRDVTERLLRGKMFEKEAPRDTRLCFSVTTLQHAEYVFAAPTMEERERWVRLLETKARGKAAPETPSQARRPGGQDASLPELAGARPRAASSGANRRLQIYGSLVCFRVQRRLIEWLRSDSEHALQPAPHAMRALDLNGAELERATSRRSACSGVPEVAAHGLRHQDQIEGEQRQRETALEAEKTALVTAAVDDLALQSVRSEIARLQSSSPGEQRQAAPGGLHYYAGWMEVKGFGASAPRWSLGRKCWRMQWCVLAGGFLLAFDKPADQLSATVRADVTCFLLGYDLVTPGSADILPGRPDCMLLVDASEPDLASRKQFLLNVPGQQVAADADPGHWTAAGDSKTAREWKTAMRRSIDEATKHTGLSLRQSKASALSDVLADNTSLLSPDVNSSTDLASPSLARQIGVKPESCWVALLCAACLSRSMQEMQATDRVQVLQAMDAWFTPPKVPNASGGPRPRAGSGSGSPSFGAASFSSGTGLSSGLGLGLRGLPVELAGTLRSSRRALLRCGLLRCVRETDGSATDVAPGVGVMLRGTSTDSTYATFLFSDILLVAAAHEPSGSSGQLGQLLNYHWHCPLTECCIGPSSELHQLCVRHSRFEWTFEPADRGGTSRTAELHQCSGVQQWLGTARAAWTHARTVQRQECRLERYEGAVLFADLSGFSNLGDELERRHGDAQGQGHFGGPRRLAAEELAKITDEEIEKMVAEVTNGGGDVIQFAGDCVIAVFPAADYQDEDLLYEMGSPTPLSLATAQASQVALQMIQSKDNFFKTQYEILDAADAAAGHGGSGDNSIQELQDALDIHAAVGSGLVYGYHVGGGAGDKWHYVVDGPAMEQVRVADDMSQAGELILSNEARNLIKPLAERIREHKRDAVTKDHKHVVVWKLESFFGCVNLQREHVWPWEALTYAQFNGQRQGTDPQDDVGLGLQYALADKLRSYIPQPVVEQVDDGQVDHRGWLQSRSVVSTMFVKLYGIDYHADNGERAVSELGSIVLLIQSILQDIPLGIATMTRVSCDDKGTSAIILCDEAASAVTAAIRIFSDVRLLGEKYTATIGITTGEVWLGVAGGETRAEYTMHGSCVNFAARLMSCVLIKQTGGVLVDEATVRACQRLSFEGPRGEGGIPTIDFEPQEPQQFKGFVNKVVAFKPTLTTTPAPRMSQTHSGARVPGQVDGTNAGFTDEPTHRTLDSLSSGTSEAATPHAVPSPDSRLGLSCGSQQAITHKERQTLQVCAVLAMASAPANAPMACELPAGTEPIALVAMGSCKFCADIVASMHPILSDLDCYSELARLAAKGGTKSKLVSLPMPPQSPGGNDSMAMYSFRCRAEMESLYHALTIDVLQLLHEDAVKEFERRLQDGTAYCIMGLSIAEAQGSKRWMCAVFEQLLRHAAASGHDARCVEYQGVLRWFDLIAA